MQGEAGRAETTDRSIPMPINWADIPWPAVGLLAGLAFISSLIGNSLVKNAIVGSILSVIVFVAVLVFWNYYPTPLQQMVPSVKFPTRI
jgi:hypothetical protein